MVYLGHREESMEMEPRQGAMLRSEDVFMVFDALPLRVCFARLKLYMTRVLSRPQTAQWRDWHVWTTDH